MVVEARATFVVAPAVVILRTHREASQLLPHQIDSEVSRVVDPEPLNNQVADSLGPRPHYPDCESDGFSLMFF